MWNTFINKVYPKLLEKSLAIFDIKSDVIVGLWSLVILVGCAYSIWATKQVSAPVATIFSVVITNFSAGKITQVWKGQATQVIADVKKDIDCGSKGDDNGTSTQG